MSATRWFILYRGPLSSCNYACGYCPFAKTRNTREELAHDADCLARFMDWVEGRPEQIGILFTPWGEALIHRHYQEAFQRLSQMPNVFRVAAQTNLSCSLDWLESCDRDSTALWTTYHPAETRLERFVEKCRQLKEIGIRHSVGVVGRKEAFEDMETLRARLPADTYLWVNAWKREAGYYSDVDLARVLAIDPHFHYNLHPHPSLGRACRAGETAFTVDGEGEVRRCHFIPERLGNLYTGDIHAMLRPRPCSIGECRCHIGYVHLKHLNLDEVFGNNILERIPHHDAPFWSSQTTQPT